MIIYFIRHAEAEATNGLSDREKDKRGLSPFGKLQAKALSRKVAEWGIEHLFSSNILRAKETALVLAQKSNLEVTFDDQLREFSKESSESLEEASKRFVEWVREVQLLPYKSIAVIIHRVVFERFLVENFRLAERRKEWMRNAGVTAIVFSPDGDKIIFIDRTFKDPRLLLMTIVRFVFFKIESVFK